MDEFPVLYHGELRGRAGCAILRAWRKTFATTPPPTTSVGPGPPLRVGSSRLTTLVPTWKTKTTLSHCKSSTTAVGRCLLPSRLPSGNGLMAWPPLPTWFLTELRIVTGRHGDPRRCPIILSWLKTQCLTPLWNLSPNSLWKPTPIGQWFMTSWRHNVVTFVMSTGRKLPKCIKNSTTIPATDWCLLSSSGR